MYIITAKIKNTNNIVYLINVDSYYIWTENIEKVQIIKHITDAATMLSASLKNLQTFENYMIVDCTTITISEFKLIDKL